MEIYVDNQRVTFDVEVGFCTINIIKQNFKYKFYFKKSQMMLEK